MDNVIIYGKNFNEIISNFEKVFVKFRIAGLKINLKKCVFLSKKIKYLGHVVSAEGVTTDLEKIFAVKDWPLLQTRRDSKFLSILLILQKIC